MCLPTPPASSRSGGESQCSIVFKLHYRRQYFVVWKVNSFFFPKNGLICIFINIKKCFVSSFNEILRLKLNVLTNTFLLLIHLLKSIVKKKKK